MENVFEDALNRLELEYEGIRNLIRRYTSEALITNYFSKLKQAMDEGNSKNLKYCLSEINRWFQNNISEMQRIDEYGYPYYVDAMQKIKELSIVFWKKMRELPAIPMKH